MARCYANENSPLEVIEALRKLGHDVLTVREAGRDNQGIDDRAVLEFAIAQQRAILTRNRRDFIRLHHDQPQHLGIVVCTEDADSEGQARRIDTAVSEQERPAGQLVRVNRPSQ